MLRSQYSMATKCWIHLLLLCLCCQFEIPPAECTPAWMLPQFPCDVMNFNSTRVLFDCKKRRLHEVPKGITSNATELILSENYIRNISAASFPNLVHLTLLDLNWANENNGLNITNGSFKNLTKLHELRLNGNHLTEIPPNIPGNVEILELQVNNITKLNKQSLAGIENVTKLFISKNCYFWHPCGKYFTVEDDSFEQMTKLQALDLSYNNITKVPKGLPKSLSSLNLSSNYIQDISEDDLAGLKKLKVLQIQGNCPRCNNAPYPCVPCENSSINIHPNAFHSLTELEILNMGGNSLKYLSATLFDRLRNLKQLLLAFNFLLDAITTNATFLTHLPMLERMDLSFNFELQKYPKTICLADEFSQLTSLRTLHLEGLVFQSIQEATLRPLYGLKNLSALNLGTNFIIDSDFKVFRKFSNLKLIYLAENRLYPNQAVMRERSDQTSCDGYSQGMDLSFSPLTIQHEKDRVYEFTHGLIKEECFNAGRVLILSSNNFFFIYPEQFEAYTDIACLNLSRNAYSAALNGTEFSSLHNLTYLDLSFNKIDLAYNNAFKELKKLEVLDLSYNAHYFKAFGVTHNLNFTQNLPVLRVLNMSYNSIDTLTTKRMYSKSLAELRFTNNNLGKLWKNNDASYNTLFTNLSNLTILDISHNGIAKIPVKVYEHLPNNLTILIISHNKLSDFIWTKLKCFPKLQTLDLSFNFLTNVTDINSVVSQTLTFLDLSHNHIFQLDSGLLNIGKSLTNISLSSNKLTMINQSTFQEISEKEIKTLFLQRNPFQCKCDSLDFIVWIKSTHIKIPRLVTEVTCGTPENQKDQALINFAIDQCENNSAAAVMYMLTTSFIMVFMFVATVSHLFYWDVSYVLNYVIAKIKRHKSLKSPNIAYDAFVTYDTNDPHVSEWVMRNLRVKLEEEGEKHLPLCLEERDWPPGVPLVDNLMQSIRYSRKTLFVLTEDYIKTGVFKLAMYLAHQRLLDENVDVIVLLMLEPVLQHSHFLRLRRRLCGKSVLEWPRTAAAEPWFWQNLRSVVRVDNQVMYNKTYSKYLTSN